MSEPTLLAELKDTLGKAAFLVVSKAEPQDIHALIVKALVIASRLQDHEHDQSRPTAAEEASVLSTDMIPSGLNNLSSAEFKEVEKVKKRLRLWIGRPQQKNARILTTFLKLRRSGMTDITEQNLRDALPPDVPFDGNFAQMKIIAERNHGKVFETNGDRVSIWAPVATDVLDFERQTFGD